MDRRELIKISSFVIIPLLLSIFGLFGLKTLLPNKTLSSIEQNIYEYNSSSVEMPKITIYEIPKTIKNPFKIVKKFPFKEKNLQKNKKWILSLIIIGKKKKFAILNNTLLKEGDIFDEFLVKKIEFDYLILKKDGIIKKIELKKIAPNSSDGGRRDEG